MSPGDGDSRVRAGGWPWRGVGPTEVVVAAVVVATVVYQYRLGRETWFFADDFRLALRGRSFGDYLRPYNHHLSFVIFGVYRLLFGLFGFNHYGPFRAIGIVSVAAVAVSIYLTTRQRVGPALAGVVGMALLWFHGTTLEPASFNHMLSLTAGIWCAWLLTRPGRHTDWLLGAMLALSLAAAGGGVAVSVACVLFCACARVPLRRWVAVLVPIAAWIVWWGVWGHKNPPIPTAAQKLLDTTRLHGFEYVTTVAKGLFGAAEGLAFGSTVGGVAVCVAFAAAAAWHLSHGLRAGAGAVAWSGAMVVWWVGLVQNRGGLAGPHVFRYQVVTVVFAILAVLPSEPIDRLRRMPAFAAPAVVALAAAVLFWANVGELRTWVDTQNIYARVAHEEAVVAGIRPSVVPPGTQFSLLLGWLDVDEFHQVVDLYGPPGRAKRSTADRVLLRMGVPAVDLKRGAAPLKCKPLALPVTVQPGQAFAIRTHRHPVTVTFRRFGDKDLTLTKVPVHTSAVLRFGSTLSSTPWVLTANGACLGP